jgi:hypothetical protein
MNDTFRSKTGLIDKILPKIKYLTFIPAAALPQAKLVMAAAYLLMGGYVILVGGDYVDAPGLDRLDRVPGVRQVIEATIVAV